MERLFEDNMTASFCLHLQELAVPLRTYSENFPNKKYLHPYERSLIELTLGDGNYEQVPENIMAISICVNQGCSKLSKNLWKYKYTIC